MAQASGRGGDAVGWVGLNEAWNSCVNMILLSECFALMDGVRMGQVGLNEAWN